MVCIHLVFRTYKVCEEVCPLFVDTHTGFEAIAQNLNLCLPHRYIRPVVPGGCVDVLPGRPVRWSNHKRFAAAALFLDVGVLEDKSLIEFVFRPVHFASDNAE